LLTRTSGYGYDILNPDLSRYIQVLGLPSILSRKNDALRVPLVFDPGTGSEYGIGIDLVGKVIETVTGPDLRSLFSAAHLRAARHVRHELPVERRHGPAPSRDAFPRA
jgi:hypothetical protein